LDKKKFTILIVPPKAIDVKGITFSSLLAKILIAFLSMAIGIFAFILYDFMVLKTKLVSPEKLWEDIFFQRSEIHYLAEKIASLKNQTNKLQDLEYEVKKGLKEVEEMKRKTKVRHLPRFNQGQLVVSQKDFSGGDRVSILERRRAPLVSQIHLKLQELRKHALQIESQLVESQKFLQSQRSVLISTPSLWPVLGRITSRFGEIRRVVSSGGTRPHKGMDIAAPIGTRILAPANGVVSFSGRESTYGLLLCIDHGRGLLTKYGHLRQSALRIGTKVKRGQVIGEVGITGQSNGPHLHYEVRLHGNPVNPRSYLTQRSQ
jgi:murein DD-endopeptidase MepM/ murein hydrolase activator NlpD